jgi:phage-related minor tail protein
MNLSAEETKKFLQVVGAKTELDSMEKSLKQIEDRLLGMITETFDDVIDSFGKTKFSFGDMVGSMMKDLAKLITRLLVVEPLIAQIRRSMEGSGGLGGFLGSLFKFADGGAFSRPTGLPHGIYTQPTLFPMAGNGPIRRFASGGILGEAGPEAIMPLKRSSSGELGVAGGGVQVNVINNAPVDVSVQEKTGPDGITQLQVMIDQRVREGLSSGRYDRVMRTSYGLGRAAMA